MIWLVIALAPLLGAALCDPGLRDRTTVIDYKLIDVEFVTDPETGDVVALSHWEYADGVRVTTKDRFKRDTPVEDRRASSRPDLRFSDIP
jgi:hypothetical protein